MQIRCVEILRFGGFLIPDSGRGDSLRVPYFESGSWDSVRLITRSSHVPKMWDFSGLLLMQNLVRGSPQCTTTVPANSCVYLTSNLAQLPWVHLRAVQEFLVQLWWMVVLPPCKDKQLFSMLPALGASWHVVSFLASSSKQTQVTNCNRAAPAPSCSQDSEKHIIFTQHTTYQMAAR